MCRNGLYTECGIKQLHGFCAERYRIDPRYAVKIDSSLDSLGVLLEPTSVVAKAWEQIERIGRRSHWEPRRVLVTGAGPIGLLAALLGVQRGLEVHMLDRVTEGPKPKLFRDLGATYHTGDLHVVCAEADIVVECTGVGQLVFEILQCTPPDGIVCLTGLSSGGRWVEVDLAALNRTLVLENDTDSDASSPSRPGAGIRGAENWPLSHGPMSPPPVPGTGREARRATQSAPPRCLVQRTSPPRSWGSSLRGTGGRRDRSFRLVAPAFGERRTRRGDPRLDS